MTLNKSDEQLVKESVSEPIQTGREYRYQADWQFQGQMYHVRCDIWEEFLEAKKNMESVLPQPQAFPNDTGPHAVSPAQVVSSVPMCGIHGTPMKQRTGQYGTFWSCGKKNADNSWCQYKPPKT